MGCQPARIDELIDCRRQKSRGESLTTSVEVDKYMCTLDLKVAERKLDQYHVYVIGSRDTATESIPV